MALAAASAATPASAAAAAGQENVKEELAGAEEEAEATEPTLVPPGVVIEKLATLIRDGRVLLRYPGPGAGRAAETRAAWGVNGRLAGSWCSFCVDATGEARFEDADACWTTEAADEWADSELELFGRFCAQAAGLPATTAPQPGASRPRHCRKAVFDHYRKEYAKKHPQAKAKAAAQAKDAKCGAAGAQAAKAGVAKAKAPAGAGKVDAGSKLPPSAKTAVSRPPDAATGPAAFASASSSSELAAAAAEVYHKRMSAFLDRVKLRLQEAKYRAFVLAISKGDNDAAVAALAAHPDLARAYPAPDVGAAAGAAGSAPPAQLAKAPPKPPPGTTTPAPAQPRAPVGCAAPAAPAQPPVDVEQEVLRPLRAATATAGADPALRLVRLVLGGRGARVSVRLAMLKYAREQTSLGEGSYREVFLLRGAPGLGKTTWATEQLRRNVVFTDEEERLSQLTHICSVDDFFTRFEGGLDGEAASETDAFEASDVELAHARNQARVMLAMEAGIQPLYVDGTHMHLWELAPYVKIAQKAGYEITFVSPEEMSENAGAPSAQALAERCASRRLPRPVPRQRLEALLAAFEPLPDEGGGEAVRAVLSITRGPAPRPVALPSARAAADGTEAAQAQVAAASSAAEATERSVLPAKRPAPPSEPPSAKLPKLGAGSGGLAKRPSPPAAPPSTAAGAVGAVGSAAPAKAVTKRPPPAPSGPRPPLGAALALAQRPPPPPAVAAARSGRPAPPAAAPVMEKAVAKRPPPAAAAAAGPAAAPAAAAAAPSRGLGAGPGPPAAAGGGGVGAEASASPPERRRVPVGGTEARVAFSLLKSLKFTKGAAPASG